MPMARTDGSLIVGGGSHDFDFVRLELLSMLRDHPHVRVRAAPNFEDVQGLDAAQFLITYTCNVEPSAEALAALRRFLGRGGRWLALHATNALLAWTDAGVDSVGGESAFIRLIGSEFKAHPPIGAFRVEPVEPEHPLVAGLEPFEVTDELYLSVFHRTPRALLAARFSGRTPAFVADGWDNDDPMRPILYLGDPACGQILYFTLGHARGHYDAPHRAPYLESVERGSWDEPVFREILRRCLDWVLSPPDVGARAGA